MPLVQLVAQHLQLDGYETDIPELRIAPTASQAKDYADHGDMFVTDCARQLAWRYEVKGLSTKFTCAADWPHTQVCVDRRHCVDKVESDCESPRFYDYVNKARTHVAILDVPLTREHLVRLPWRAQPKSHRQLRGRLRLPDRPGDLRRSNRRPHDDNPTQRQQPDR